jgi:hypothetical protein
LEFDFKSTAEGEVHGIGLDTEDTISAESTFQLFGTQTWGIQAYRTYPTGADIDGYVSYTIPVGAFFTGAFDRLVFANDHDVASPTAEGIFRNVRLYEGTPPATQLNVDIGGVVTAYDILTYGGSQDVTSTVSILDGGDTVQIVGNAWKKVQFAAPYNVTASTVLEFDFSSALEGDVHGIGFDTDDGLSSGTTFQLVGTQNGFGLQDYRTYPTGADVNGVVHYVIPVGTFFTGAFDRLIFANDHDVPTPTAESVLSNIMIYEAP